MKYDITPAEQTFSALQAGITLHVLGQFQEYETKLTVLIEEIKKLREENIKLQKETKECKEDCKS